MGARTGVEQGQAAGREASAAGGVGTQLWIGLGVDVSVLSWGVRPSIFLLHRVILLLGI